MKNRFLTVKKRRRGQVVEILLPVLLFILALAFLFGGMAGITQTTEKEQLASVERAITRATVQCYAIEGHYAPNLEYLENHYGLLLDRERFIIQYDIFGANLMPTILVLPMGFLEEEVAHDAF